MLKRVLKSTPFYGIFKKIYRILKRVPRHPLQDTRETAGFNIIHLGTEYGGWSFVDEECLHGSTIISAGLGEDASFDVEFASKYNAKVIIIDPTPRSIKHFNEIRGSFGNPSSESYSDDGKLKVNSYDLSNINENNLILIDKALWNESKTLRFYEPNNPQHVSHSIVNYQNNYSTDTNFIDVQAVTLGSLLDDINLKPSKIYLMKLDIEGAEIEVLKQFLSAGIFPRQILVEFDELNIPSPKNFNRITEIDKVLKYNNYMMLKTNGKADFLYFRG